MEELKDVVLNIYTLLPAATTDNTERQQAATSFLSRLLPTLGMGAYHTELVLDGYRYTFAANVGIVKMVGSQQQQQHQQIPQGSFREAIPLGSCRPSRKEINAILKKLGDSYFTNNAYHLVHRNCNHFTETFATALILHDDLIELGPQETNVKKRLQTYPDWVNRLASTGSRMIAHDDDIVPCQIWYEAAMAVGADTKISWNLESNKTTIRKHQKLAASGKKKELTEQQKAILAKIRK